MSTHYGLQIESPFDLKDSATVAITIQKGETKTIDRAGVSGILAIVVKEGGSLNYTEKISEAGLYHTYIYLQGKDSILDINSRVMLEQDLADISHQVIHEKDNTISNIKAKGIVGGSALVIYNSKISVSPNVKNVGGTQDAQFVLLENTSKVKTIPALSVYSDEVSCSHKISVSPMDKKNIEFLAMRGYEAAAAQDILIAAFLE